MGMNERGRERNAKPDAEKTLWMAHYWEGDYVQVAPDGTRFLYRKDLEDRIKAIDAEIGRREETGQSSRGLVNEMVWRRKQLETAVDGPEVSDGAQS